VARTPLAELHPLTPTSTCSTASSGRKQSRVEASWDLWHLWTIQDGKVGRGQAFTERDEALEAAGPLDPPGDLS
jgi:hypothetical protein